MKKVAGVRAHREALTEYRRVVKQLNGTRLGDPIDQRKFYRFAFLQGAMQALGWVRRDWAMAVSRYFKVRELPSRRETSRRGKA